MTAKPTAATITPGQISTRAGDCVTSAASAVNATTAMTMPKRWKRYIQIQNWGRHVWNFNTQRGHVAQDGAIRSLNVSLVILTTHGWLYVLYMALNFLLWRFTRWEFWRFVFIAFGGVIPLLSFFFEFAVPRWVRAEIANKDTAPE